MRFLRPSLTFFLLSFFVIGCSSSLGKNNGLDQSSPRSVVQEWFSALEKKDTKVLLALIEEKSWIGLEKNFKLYLQTLKELDSKKNEGIDRILSLQGEKFLESFLNWAYQNFSIKNLSYVISEIRTGEQTSTVSVFIGNKLHKIALIKENKNWFIKASYLEDFSLSQENKEKKSLKKVKK